MAARVKVLIAGDVRGHFRDLFSKASKANEKHGPFEALFCLGNFFGDDVEEYEDLKLGKIPVPVFTYILNGNQSSFEEFFVPLHKEIPKIEYLGNMGYLTVTGGLKVAYLSGVEMPGHTSEGNSSSHYCTYITKKLVDTMIKTVGSGIDILLTSQWPKDVTKYAVSLDKEKESKMNACNSSLISHLAAELKPCYHFSAMTGFFYERLPYRNHSESDCYTRFLGLAPVKNKESEKWMFALKLVPSCHMTDENRKKVVVKSSTSLPYQAESLNMDEYKNFFFAGAEKSSTTKRSAKDCVKTDFKKPALDASNCWFCLSNSNVEKNLVITIGEHCYITLAKGPLVAHHVLIVPIHHVSSCVELSQEAFNEVEKFKVALIEYFNDKSLDVVFFERNYRSPHLQIQAVPVCKKLQKKIDEKILSYAKDYGLTQLPSEANVRKVLSEDSRAYFYLEVFQNKEPNQKYMAFIEKSCKDFPLQIGRSIMAEVLNLEDRIDWQKCVEPETEIVYAEEMRRTFKSYDPTEE